MKGLSRAHVNSVSGPRVALPGVPSASRGNGGSARLHSRACPFLVPSLPSPSAGTRPSELGSEGSRAFADKAGRISLPAQVRDVGRGRVPRAPQPFQATFPRAERKPDGEGGTSPTWGRAEGGRPRGRRPAQWTAGAAADGGVKATERPMAVGPGQGRGRERCWSGGMDRGCAGPPGPCAHGRHDPRGNVTALGPSAGRPCS